MHYTYKPKLRELPAMLDPIPDHHVQDFWNKSMPIYLFTAANMEPGHTQIKIGRLTDLIVHALHNYIYWKWFRPCSSDIEFGQFLAKVIKPMEYGLDTSSEAAIVRLATASQRRHSRPA